MRHESAAHAHEGTTVLDYVRILRRRKWIVLVAVILVPLAAVAWSVRQEPVYVATADVWLSNQDISGGVTGFSPNTVYRTPERNAQTQAELAMTPVVAENTLAATGIDSMTPTELLGSVSVVPALDSDLLSVSVTNTDPELAQRLAEAYAREFTEYKENFDTVAIRRALADVEAQLRELEARGESTAGSYDSLLEYQQTLQTMEVLAAQSAFLVGSPTRAVQISPQPFRNGVIGLMLGIILGLGLAFLRETLDTRVRTAEEVSERLHLPLLARLPAPPRRLAKSDRLVMLDEPTSPDAEAVRMLRTNFDFVNLERDARVVMVTSAVPSEGKSTTAANLAIALARGGRRVTLVDLDLRRPYIARFFDLNGTAGLTQVALGRVELDDAIVSIGLSNGETGKRDHDSNGGNGHAKLEGFLNVLTTGPIPPDAGEFVGTHAVATIIETLREQNDFVIVDAPPLLHVGDAMALTSRVDGLLLVARLNLLRRPMLRELSRLLHTTPAQPLGFVVTGAESEIGYGYGTGYGYGYDEPAPSGRRSSRIPVA